MSLFLPAVIGICVGVIVGLLGAGGGILSVPILVYLLGQSPHNAAAGSLLIVGATSLIALIGRRKEVHWKQGAVFGVLSITGSFFRVVPKLSGLSEAINVSVFCPAANSCRINVSQGS